MHDLNLTFQCHSRSYTVVHHGIFYYSWVQAEGLFVLVHSNECTKPAPFRNLKPRNFASMNLILQCL